MDENDLTGLKFGKLLVLKMAERKSNRHSTTWICECECGRVKKFRTSLLLGGTITCCGCTKPKVSDDINGMKFGRLTAIKFVKMDKNHRRIWLCKCDCGVEKEVIIDKLLNGNTISCGCYQKEVLFQDITGQKFNRLTVIMYLGKNEYSNCIWKCKCDCGNYVIEQTSQITQGKVKSCGCYRDEKISKMARSKRGKHHHMYNPNMTDEERMIGRRYPEYNDWRISVYRRDKNQCVICDSKDTINAHHIFSYKDYKGLRLEIDNGISLCDKCHKEYHFLFGNKTGNLLMFIDYLRIKFKVDDGDQITKIFKMNAKSFIDSINSKEIEIFDKKVKKEKVSIYLFIIMYLNYVKTKDDEYALCIKK